MIISNEENETISYKTLPSRPIHSFLSDLHASTMPRCCAQFLDEFAPCYASTLVVGSADRDALSAAVSTMEEKLTPCVSTWCHACGVCSVTLVGWTGDLPLSEHYAHLLVARRSMMQQTK